MTLSLEQFKRKFKLSNLEVLQLIAHQQIIICRPPNDYNSSITDIDVRFTTEDFHIGWVNSEFTELKSANKRRINSDKINKELKQNAKMIAYLDKNRSSKSRNINS